MQSITNKVLPILAEYANVDQNQIKLEDELKTINIDSLSLIEIIFDIEENFDITVPDLSELETRKLPLATVADVIKLVSRLVEEQANQN